MTSLGHEHHLHPQTNRNQGKQILMENQQDNLWKNAKKIWRALDRQLQDGHLHIIW